MSTQSTKTHNNVWIRETWQLLHRILEQSDIQLSTNLMMTTLYFHVRCLYVFVEVINIVMFKCLHLFFLVVLYHCFFPSVLSWLCANTLLVKWQLLSILVCLSLLSKLCTNTLWCSNNCCLYWFVWVCSPNCILTLFGAVTIVVNTGFIEFALVIVSCSTCVLYCVCVICDIYCLCVIYIML